MRRASRVLIVGLAALAAAAGCTVKKTTAPVPTGPSELGLSLSLLAIPDTISQDGASQAQVAITARDPLGQPLGNVSLRLDVTVNGAVVDYGSLSAKNVVTAGDGKAAVTYTAPPPTIDPSYGGTTVTLLVTPIGTNYDNTFTRSVSLRLVPSAVIQPPTSPDAPIAEFAFSPLAPLTDQDVSFNASASKAGPGRTIVSYDWDFGSGTPQRGVIVSKPYDEPGTYIVTLTVTDDVGQRGKVSKLVTIKAR